MLNELLLMFAVTVIIGQLMSVQFDMEELVKQMRYVKEDVFDLQVTVVNIFNSLQANQAKIENNYNSIEGLHQQIIDKCKICNVKNNEVNNT